MWSDGRSPARLPDSSEAEIRDVIDGIAEREPGFKATLRENLRARPMEARRDSPIVARPGGAGPPRDGRTRGLRRDERVAGFGAAGRRGDSHRRARSLPGQGCTAMEEWVDLRFGAGLPRHHPGDDRRSSAARLRAGGPRAEYRCLDRREDRLAGGRGRERHLPARRARTPRSRPESPRGPRWRASAAARQPPCCRGSCPSCAASGRSVTWNSSGASLTAGIW